MLISIFFFNQMNQFFESSFKSQFFFTLIQFQQFFPRSQMTSKADIEKTQFHNYQNHARLNNPTFNSSFVNDSLSIFTPQRKEVEPTVKQSEYKSNFEPFNDKVNTLSVYQQSRSYARISKQAYEKSKSYLSQCGSNFITNKSQSQLNKK